MSISSTPVFSEASPWASETLELIDSVIADRVLIYGSLPPEGGDLDILARPAELSAIREALIAAGFIPIRRMLVRFRPGHCEMVELTPTDAWKLPSVELAALFAEAQPVAGTQWLAQPSPHHALLIRARKAVRRPPSLRKLRVRMAATLAKEPDALSRAAKHAVAWNAKYALRALCAASERAGRVPTFLRWRAVVEQYGGREASGARGWLRLGRALLPRWLAPRFRPTHVITFSGLDGSGKSSQARLLRDALRATGQDVVVIWAGIGTNRSLRVIKAPVKRALRLLPRVGPFRELAERATPKANGAPNPLAEPGARIRRHGAGFTLVAQVWMLVMALVNVYSMRKALLRSFGKGRVVIFDRYTLDSAVRLQHWYGDNLASRLVVRLIYLLNKRPTKAYFLDVAPDVAFGRKPEWELRDFECRGALYETWQPRLGVRRLDGTRPKEDLFAEIASDVWSALR